MRKEGHGFETHRSCSRIFCVKNVATSTETGRDLPQKKIFSIFLVFFHFSLYRALDKDYFGDEKFSVWSLSSVELDKCFVECQNTRVW